MHRLGVIICAVGCGIGSTSLAQADLEYGAYLGSECVTCHQTDETNDAIPQISGLGIAEFSAALRQYQSKARAHSGMQMISARLNDEDIAALAAYFNSLEPK